MSNELHGDAPKVEEIRSQLLAVTAKVARGVYMPDIDNCRDIREARAVMERGDALRIGLLHELNKVLEQLTMLRPYFPPASQTPDFKTLNATIGDLGEIAEMLREPQHEPTGFDLSIALRLEQITQTLKSIDPLATPASTARTDGWIDPENYVAWCRRSKNTIVTCDSDAPGAFKVYRLARTALDNKNAAAPSARFAQ